MSATYDPTLPSNKDWVRFLVGDRGTIVSGTTVSGTILSDEEIAGLLTEEANKYLAAYRAGMLCLTKNKGLSSKTVGDLSISYATSKYASYADYLQALREKGCQLLLRSTGGSVLRSV